MGDKINRGQEGKRTRGQASKKHAFLPSCLLAFLLLSTIQCSLIYPLTANAQDTAINISDSTKLVKIAISDTSFKTLAYSKIGVTATAEYAVYDKATSRQIMKFLPTDVVQINFSAGNFDITLNNKTVASNQGVLVFDCPTGMLGVGKLVSIE